MNRLNWIQQEQKVADYHVLTWRTSHFHHPRNRTDIVAVAQGKYEGGAAASSGGEQQIDGIGPGLSDKTRSNVWRSGEKGSGGLSSGIKDVHQDMPPVSDKKNGQHSTVPKAEFVTSAIHQEVFSVVNNTRQAVEKVHGRIRESVGKLRDLYHNQPKQTADTSARQGKYHRPSEKEKRGTRPADKEEVLAMQAENHYLLDSYNRNGQYSMLGK